MQLLTKISCKSVFLFFSQVENARHEVKQKLLSRTMNGAEKGRKENEFILFSAKKENQRRHQTEQRAEESNRNKCGSTIRSYEYRIRMKNVIRNTNLEYKM